MTEDELHTALETDGTTLARVAKDEGVAVDTLVDALVTAQQDRIASAVEDGRLTHQEADKRLADLEARVTERVSSAVPAGGPGHGGSGAHGDRADTEGTPAD